MRGSPIVIVDELPAAMNAAAMVTVLSMSTPRQRTTAVLSADGPAVSNARLRAEAYISPRVAILPPAGLAGL